MSTPELEAYLEIFGNYFGLKGPSKTLDQRVEMMATGIAPNEAFRSWFINFTKTARTNYPNEPAGERKTSRAIAELFGFKVELEIWNKYEEDLAKTVPPAATEGTASSSAQ